MSGFFLHVSFLAGQAVFLMITNISKYFPHLSPEQFSQFETLMRLYPEWNARINVISRKDIDNLEINHILHSLAIARFISFKQDSHILDFGSGGGLPGLPLAIIFPDSHFHLIDRVGKKLRVAEDIARQAGIENISLQHGDIGECHKKFEFILSRGVMPQPDLIRLARKNVSSENKNAIPNGFISLKGGELSGELGNLKTRSEIIDIHSFFPLPFFETKKIVYTPA